MYSPWGHHLLVVCGWQKWLRFGFAKDCGFRFDFGVIKLTAVSVFSVQFCRRHLSFTPLRYDARNDVLPCWIGPTNCQPMWLRTRSAETRHKEKYFDCLVLWFLSYKRWIVNETAWKPSPNRRSRFFKNRTAETEFSVFEFWGQFGSVRFLENWYPTFSSGSAHTYHLRPTRR